VVQIQALVVILALNVVDNHNIEWLQVQMCDSLWVDLVQAEQKVTSNDLDVAQVKSFAAIYYVSKRLGGRIGSLN